MSNNVSIKVPKGLLDRIKTIRRLKAVKDNKDVLILDVIAEMVEVAEKKYDVKDGK